MAIEPHVHEYALRVEMIETGEYDVSISSAFCKHPECDHELDAQGIISGLNASACIDQEQAEELSKLLYADGDSSGEESEYSLRYDMAQHLERYAASLSPVVKVG
jgi:hypothetical protein